MGSLSRSDLRAVVDLARILPPALRRLDDRDVLLELAGRRPTRTVTVCTTAPPRVSSRPVPRRITRPGERWAAAELEALLTERLTLGGAA